MIALGYFLALVVGFLLGVLGTGGATLSVPVFAYIWQFQDKQAIASGFVIAVLVGMIPTWKYYKHGYIHLKALALFGPTSVGGTYLGVLLSSIIPGNVQLFMLSVIMVVAALSMYVSCHEKGEETSLSFVNMKTDHPVLIGCLSVLVGCVIGLAGIGGGFILLPILMNVVHLPLRHAIGTALLIATLNALVGGALCMQYVTIPWDKVLSFAAIAIVGGIAGAYLNAKLPVSFLKKAFATILLVVACAIAYEKRLSFSSAEGLLSFLYGG